MYGALLGDVIGVDHVKTGDAVTSREEMLFRLHHIRTKDGKQRPAAFTSDEECGKGEVVSVLSDGIRPVFDGMRGDAEGWDHPQSPEQPFLPTKDRINMILN